MANYLEQLFEGIDIIVGKRLEAISYDTTIICRVVDTSDAKNGQYLVNDGSVNFLAYSEKDDYKQNDSVRVLVPQGNKSESKYIIGKAVSGTASTPLTFVSTLESAVNIEEFNLNRSLYSIKANGKKDEILLARFIVQEPNDLVFNEEVSFISPNLLKSNLCNTITLSGEFKTLLSNYNLTSGIYGLRLRIYEQVDSNPNALTEHIAEFSSEEMFGNPYLYSIYSLQGKVFGTATLGSLERIKEIDIYLYQNQDFKLSTGEKIGYKYSGTGEILTEPDEYFLFDNILVQNLHLGLGTNIVDIEDNTLTLYTEDSPLFDYDKKSEADNTRSLRFSWFNKDDNNKYIGFSDNKTDEKSKSYDEMAYLDLSKKVAALQSKIGKENIPTDEDGLNLASDIDKVAVRVQNSIKVYKTDLTSHLRRLRQVVVLENDPIGKYLEQLNSDILRVEGALSGEGLLNNLISYYDKVLKYGYEIQMSQPHEEVWNDAWVNLDNHSALGTALFDLENKFKALLNTTLPPLFENAFQDTFASYKILLEQDLEKIIALSGRNNAETAIDRVLYDLTDNVNKLNYYKIATEIEPWTAPSLEDYNYRYCIYWYRYSEGYISSDAYNFMGENWERIGKINEGLPIDEELKITFPKDDLFKKTIALDSTRQEEKYAMVVFYNHVKFVSNELRFSNIVDISTRELAETSGSILIEHGEKSKQAYFDYSIAKTLSVPIESAYPRCIRARLVNSQSDEASLNGRIITWAFPNVANTMLKEESNLAARGFTRTISADGEWIYFSKEIKYNADANNFLESNGFDSRDFWYCIKDYYISTALQNTIQCKISDLSGNFIEGQIDFEFGTEGTNGTPYTLRVIPTTARRAVTPSHAFEAKLELVDELEQPVSAQFSIEVVQGVVTQGSQAIELIGDKLKVTNWYGLIKIKAKIEDTNLSLIYSIPYTTDDNCEHLLSGIIDFIYDSYGTLNNNYPNIPYEFYPKVENTNVTMEYYKNNVSYTLAAAESKFYPQLKENKLIVPQMYISDSDVYAVIVLQSGALIWKQFLTIEQNRFGSKVLNGWDGNFQIDENKGTILSTMIGAGRKDNENQFNGILMGDVIAGAEVDSNSGIGLYGYHAGAQSFGFTIDGTAFLGKSGQGRILFDGNNGVIKSATWPLDGMYIDIDNGIIKIEQKDNKILLSAFDTENFKISKNDKNLISIGANDYYLQSYNYDNANGMKIDLSNGLLDAYNFILTSKGIKMNSNPNDGDYYIMIGDPNTAEHISLDKNMHLDMQLSSLSIYSGENILRNTTPYEAIGTTKLANWSTLGGVQLSSEEKDKKKSICCKNVSNTDMYFWQMVPANKNSVYTISGYAYYEGAGDPRVGFNFSGSSEQVVTLPYGSWIYFSKTVEVGNYSGETVRFTINPKDVIGNYFFANLKLEEGSLASAWSPSPKDNRQEIISQLELNTDDGIYLESGVLYVNASAIKTGSLTSKNYAEDENGNVTAGTSFDLDNGILKSANLSITSTNFALTSEGEISAKKGLIGGWTIGANNLYGTDSNGTTKVVLDARATASHTISVGDYTNFSDNVSTNTGTYFGVTPSGELQARGGTFKGNIYAWGGQIGGISIYGDRIGSDSWSLSGEGLQTGGIWIKNGIIGGPGGGDTEWGADIYFQGQLKGVNNTPLRVNSLAIGNSDGVNLSLSGTGTYLEGTISKALNADAIKVNSYTIANSSIKVLGTSAASLGSHVQIGAKSELTFSTITSGSSKRFKNSITEDFDSSLLYRLKPVSYYYNKEMGYGGDKRYGFIAEAVDKIAPELVEHDYENPELCNALYYNSIITLAVAEIQKLRKEIDILKEKKEND